MAARHVLAAAVWLIGLAGCAVHPVSDVVTGYNPDQIVRKVRCETRQAYIDKITLILGLGEFQKRDTVDRDYYLGLRNRTKQISQMNWDRLQEPARTVMKFFSGVSVAYDFTLDISETNNLEGSIDIIGRLKERGTLGLGLSGGVERIRSNKQTFTVTDTFKGFADKYMQGYCSEKFDDRDPASLSPIEASSRYNYVYPIAGKIGIDKILDEFFDLVTFAGLDAKSSAGAGAPPSVTHDLLFTTTVFANADPKVVISPVLIGASGKFDNKRVDRHEVIIVLAAPRRILNGSVSGVDFVDAASDPGAIPAVKSLSDFIARNKVGQTTIIFNNN